MRRWVEAEQRQRAEVAHAEERRRVPRDQWPHGLGGATRSRRGRRRVRRTPRGGRARAWSSPALGRDQGRARCSRRVISIGGACTPALLAPWNWIGVISAVPAHPAIAPRTARRYQGSRGGDPGSWYSMGCGGSSSQGVGECAEGSRFAASVMPRVYPGTPSAIPGSATHPSVANRVQDTNVGLGGLPPRSRRGTRHMTPGRGAAVAATSVGHLLRCIDDGVHARDTTTPSGLPDALASAAARIGEGAHRGRSRPRVRGTRHRIRRRPLGRRVRASRDHRQRAALRRPRVTTLRRTRSAGGCTTSPVRPTS